jgi:hypothetical protein
LLLGHSPHSRDLPLRVNDALGQLRLEEKNLFELEIRDALRQVKSF